MFITDEEAMTRGIPLNALNFLRKFAEAGGVYESSTGGALKELDRLLDFGEVNNFTAKASKVLAALGIVEVKKTSRTRCDSIRILPKEEWPQGAEIGRLDEERRKIEREHAARKKRNRSAPAPTPAPAPTSTPVSTPVSAPSLTDDTDYGLLADALLARVVAKITEKASHSDCDEQVSNLLSILKDKEEEHARDLEEARASANEWRGRAQEAEANLARMRYNRDPARLAEVIGDNGRQALSNLMKELPKG